MKTFKMRHFLQACLLCALQTLVYEAKAQLNPMGAIYFQNQYLANPAMAGMAGLNADLGYRQQWSSLPGAPSTQTLTADYAFTGKAGAGISVYNERAGLFRRIKTAATYAYHLPLGSDNQKLSFGLSLGLMSKRISNEEIDGDVNDLNVLNYNQRAAYLDGDFGMAYTSDKLNVQVALPNMKDLLKKDLVNGSVDQSTFFSAVSYRIKASGDDGIGIEPKLVYRGIKGLKDILDAGMNLSYANNKINLFGMYRTSQNATFGLGINYQSLSITAIYTTTAAGLKTYASGNYEIGLKARIL